MKRRSKNNRSLAATATLLAVAGLMTGPLAAQTAFSADGVIESTSGGFKFPDGSVQTTAGATAPVADTGQTGCWDDKGVARSCAGTGEDGETQAGLAWPSPRFTDNGDGTVSDNLTGLDWLQDGNCPATDMGWQAALTWVTSTLNAGGTACANYVAGAFSDWRLPNVMELISLADISQSNPALSSGHPFLNVVSGVSGEMYWSSSSPSGFPAAAYILFVGFGASGTQDKDTTTHYVWPVRGGH